MIVFVTAAFLIAGAQAAFGVVVPVEQSAGVGTTGVGTTGAQQSTSVCPEPRLAGLPTRAKFTNATIHFKILNLTQGAAYLVKAGRGEVQSGFAATPGTAKNSFQLPDQGTRSKKINIEAVVSNDQCENGPWKLVKKIRYKAVVAPAAPQAPAASQPATPAKPATPVPVAPVKPIKPIKPVKPESSLPKLPPRANFKIRSWMTPFDGGSRLAEAPSGPKLSRTERKADKAQSSAALFGLAGLFVLMGVLAVVGLALYSRRDNVVLGDAFGVLPQHLEEGSPDMPQPGEEPDTAPLSAHMLEHAPPAPLPVEPRPVEVPAPAPAEAAHAAGEENGSESPTHHREQIEAELQRLLTEAGIDAPLGGILADAQEDAARQGIALDADAILRAVSEELNGFATLSEASRNDLRTMFEGIFAEESERGPQESLPPLVESVEPPLADSPVSPPGKAESAEKNGNGAGSPTRHREQIEAELRRLLKDAGIDTELEGILATAQEEAARQGVVLDADAMLRAISDELQEPDALSESKRAGLRAMFEGILTDESERLPQQAS